MGIYSQLAKIEALLEANTEIDSLCWTHGYCNIEQLPKEKMEALISFGYTKDALLFGVNCAGPEQCEKHDVLVIADPDGGSDWTKLLYKDTNSNRFCYFDSSTERKDSKKNRETVDRIYVQLQKLFIFLDLYVKQREQMRRSVEIEYDSLQSSLEE